MKWKKLRLVGSLIILLGACETVSPQNDSAANADAGEAMASFGAEDAGQWPPAGCPDANAVRAFVKGPANQGHLAYFGLYSDGNAFWMGYDHGNQVLKPKTSYRVPIGKQPFVMRWNISDKPPGGQTVNKNYRFDHDSALHGDYAVTAFAINQCITDQFGGYGSCDQPIFGEAAWREDAEFCPPVILPEDGDSIYLWDRNPPRTIPQVYEYSLALILKGQGPNDPKAGIRIIVDPKVQNGGVGTR